MSSAPRLLAVAAAALAVLFLAGAGLGRLLDPAAPGAATAAEGGGSGHAAMASEHGGASGADPVRGLGVAEHGLRLVLADPERTRGVAEPLRFAIVAANGVAVTDFDETHTKRMHLILARRDLTGFQHLHPEMDAAGIWTVPLRLDAAGSYRVFADFSHDDEATTLATDLRVDGSADLVGLPAPAAVAQSDGGYRVRLDDEGARAGQPSQIQFTVSRAGRPVALQPYLGAAGHLVALREGDLAFLHVHPQEHGLAFAATFPSPGSYRLFLQFRVGGALQTVAFTEEVE
jgi:hypothetical protein